MCRPPILSAHFIIRGFVFLEGISTLFVERFQRSREDDV